MEKSVNENLIKFEMQKEYCRIFARDDGFVHCEDCMNKDTCKMTRDTWNVFEYCEDFMTLPF